MIYSGYTKSDNKFRQNRRANRRYAVFYKSVPPIFL